jgi:hypothetical protein
MREIGAFDAKNKLGQLAAQKSARTRRAYRLDVRHFMATLGITSHAELRQVDHRAVIAWERIMRETQRAAPSTIRRRLSALSSLFKQLVRHGRAGKNPVRSSARRSTARKTPRWRSPSWTRASCSIRRSSRPTRDRRCEVGGADRPGKGQDAATHTKQRGGCESPLIARKGAEDLRVISHFCNIQCGLAKFVLQPSIRSK